MIYALFKLTFTPNNPVCEGEFIFIKEYNKPSEKYDIHIWANREAKKLGAYRVEEDSTLAYICTVDGSHLINEQGYYLVSIQTGEY